MSLKDITRVIAKRIKYYHLHNILKFSINKGILRQSFHFALKGHLFRKYRVNHYLLRNQNTLTKLQIGGGYHLLKNWINGDLIAGEIYLNAKKKFPFPDKSVDFIFAEQFIEHLDFDYGFICLSECYRVLKIGGKIRFSTPDLNLLISTYKDQNPNVKLKLAMERHKKNHNNQLSTPGHFLNDFFRLWGHLFLYDEKTLRMQMRNVGFSTISRQKFGDSINSEFSNLERHADVDWMKNGFQLILEATKE